MAGFGVDRGGGSSSGLSESGLTEIIDAKGDLLVGTADNVADRLAVGTNETRLVADSGETTGLKYVADTTNYAVAAKGDLLAGTAADTVAPLTVGANETRVVAASAEATGLKYVADTVNYAVAAKGDLLVGTAADTVAPLTVGANGTIPMARSGETAGIAWEAAFGKYIDGLVLSNSGVDATNDIVVSAGGCMSGDGAEWMALAAALTKRIDASWVVGDTQGGLDGTESVAGTPDDDTWYYVWLIKRADTGVVDALFSESSSAPTMPTNYGLKRLVGAVLRGTAANLAFESTETSGGGLEVRWTTPPLDVNASDTLGQSRLLSTLSIPVLPVWVTFRHYIFDASAAFNWIIQSPDETDAAPISTASPLRSGPPGSTSVAAQGTMRVRTSTGQIAARVDAGVVTADNYRIVTLGWEWGRR
jgi:hypothetical protein